MARLFVSVDAATLRLPAEVEAALKSDLATTFDTQVTQAITAASEAQAAASIAVQAAQDAQASTQQMVDDTIDNRLSQAVDPETIPERDSGGAVAVGAPTDSAHAVPLGYGVFHGADGKTYATVAGTIRNSGSPDYWQPINDAGHEPCNVDSVNTTTSAIEINFGSLNATKILTFVVSPDETLAGAGFTVGASVALNKATLYLRRTTGYADYVSWDGSQFVSANGVFTTAWDGATGILTLTHPTLATSDPTHLYDVSVTGRGDSLASSHGVTATTALVRFFDYSGALLTSPATNTHRVFVRHGANGPADPQQVSTAAYPNSNLWFFGIVEVA